MAICSRFSITAVLASFCFALAVHADQPQQAQSNPGFRPDADLSAAFVAGASAAQHAVFPTIVRTTEGTSYSSVSQQWVLGFLQLNDLGSGKIVDTRFDMPKLTRSSQWEMFQSSMTAIGRQVGGLEIEADYAIVVEIVIPPIPSQPMQVFGVHCFVLANNGANAFSFLLNSHHQAFNDADLRTSEPGASGKEILATAATKLALITLKMQLDQERESEQPGSTRVDTIMVDDFQAGLPSGTDSVGLPIGFHTFTDAKSVANVSVTTAHPPRPGETSGNQVLQLAMDVTGWAGFIHSFENAAADEWISRNWRTFTGFSFWLYGNNTGALLFVDVLDNRKRYSTTDDAERYTFEFRDDFAGWKQLTVPFAKMARKEIRNKAPRDGLNLSDVHGWAFGNWSSVREITYYIDDFELYGGRVNVPTDELLPPAAGSRWRNLEAKEGRFRIAVGVRLAPPASVEPSDCPKLAVYSWHYRHRSNGMPKDQKELKEIIAWARRLDDLLVAERNGFQFANRGGAKKLAAYFYVADVEQLRALSLQAGEQALRTQMQFAVSDDPNWEEWTKMGRPPDGANKSAASRAAGTPVPVSAMEPVLRFDGFSVRRPNDYRWRLLGNRSGRHVADFSFAPLSPTHSFNAHIRLRGLPREFLDTGEFKAFFDAKLRDHDPRFEMLSFDSFVTELHGQWAIEYQALFLDKSPSNSETPLLMTTKGAIALHPLRNRMAIDAFWSERGTRDDLDGTLDAVGQALINGVIPEK